MFQETKTIERRAGSGRKPKTEYPEKARKKRQYFKNNPNLPTRDMAKKVNSSKWFVQQTMKQIGLRVFEVRKVPTRTDKKNTVAKLRARKLYREWLVKPGCLVMDDKAYIKVDTKQIHGLEFFVGTSRMEVPEEKGGQIREEVPVVADDLRVRTVQQAVRHNRHHKRADLSRGMLAEVLAALHPFSPWSHAVQAGSRFVPLRQACNELVRNEGR